MQNRLGEAIQLRRKSLRIRQPDLAELAEVSINTVNKIEQGKGNPTLKVLTKIADILGMELSLDVKPNKG
jgi:transcriptional regulator with XRE-family HTH domain